MSIEGRLTIKLNWLQQEVSKVDVRQHSPVVMSHVFKGKTPEQLLSLMSTMYTKNRFANSYAAFQCCTQLLNHDRDERLNAAQQLIVDMEMLLEHATRLLQWFPAVFKHKIDQQTVQRLLSVQYELANKLFVQQTPFTLHARLVEQQHFLSELINRFVLLLEDAVFKKNAEQFLQLSSIRELLSWLDKTDTIPSQLLQAVINKHWQSLGKNDILPLPNLDAIELYQRFDADTNSDFTLFPDWLGRCRESTAASRLHEQTLVFDSYCQYGNGLLTGLLARMVDIAILIADIKDHRQGIQADDSICEQISNGLGVTQLYCAKGLLVHRLQLQQGLVSDYRIISPAAWNCHPQGMLAKSLRNLKSNNTDELQTKVNLLVKNIDPGIPYQLIINDSIN